LVGEGERQQCREVINVMQVDKEAFSHPAPNAHEKAGPIQEGFLEEVGSEPEMATRWQEGGTKVRSRMEKTRDRQRHGTRKSCLLPRSKVASAQVFIGCGG
jgi:hypothetical protein